MTINLSDKHQAILDKIFCDFIPHTLAIKIYLFGSRATNKAKPASDIDLAFECLNGEKMPFSVFLNLGTAFEESDLPLFVDMIDMNNTSETIKQEIIKTGCIIWQR